MKGIFLTLLLAGYSLASLSQNIAGNWEGSLEISGNDIPIVFHISNDSAGNLVATFDSPSQHAYSLSCNEVTVSGDSVILMMRILGGKYAAKLSEDKKQLSGIWFQGGGSLPLIVKKTSDVAIIKKINRPQTPKPPYPYKSEEVEYYNADKSIRFGGTLTVPIPDPNVEYFRAPVYPTLLLITGSGKQDRDETIMNHKPFAVIADYLTRQGFAVLRVDDRQMGKTTGNFGNSTTADFAADVEAGIDFLKTRKETDSFFIGLLGHSEGALIAPMVAAKRTDVKFIILLAGPGVKITELMEQQNVDVLASMGVSQKKLLKFRPLYRNMINIILAEKDTASAKEKAFAVFRAWQKNNSSSLVKATTGVVDKKSLVAFIYGMVKQLHQPWFNYFMRLNPAVYLSHVNCAALALNGEKDIQVAAGPNLAAIKSALENNKNPHFKTVEIRGVNHLFQHCKKCTVEEYGELEETIAPEVLEMISKWIKEKVY